MAITYFRMDGWLKTAQGPAIAGGQIWVCTQPANISNEPTPLALIYSDPNGLVPIAQPIITDGLGHYDFYALPGLYTVVVSVNGMVQTYYPDQDLGLGGGSGTTLLLEVNGAPNGSQTLLNLTGAGNTTVTDTGTGTVIISSTGGGGGSGNSPTFHGWSGTITGPTGSAPAQLASGTSQILPSFPYNPTTINQVSPTSTNPIAQLLYAAPSGTNASITAWSITSNVATFTYTSTSSIQPKETVYLSGFGTSTFFNGQLVTVVTASPTSFTAHVTHANGSATENGAALPLDQNGGGGAFTTYSYASGVFQLNGSLASNTELGTALAIESTGGSLDGTTGNIVTYVADALLNVSYTSANDSAYEIGYLYQNGTFIQEITGWEIVSNVLTFYCSNSSVPTSGVITVEGLVHGSYINGASLTYSSSSTSGFVLGTTTVSGSGSGSTGTSRAYLPYSSSILCSAQSQHTFALGSLSNWSCRAQVPVTGTGRFWLGFGNALSISQSSSTYQGNVLATDSPAFSTVGFRYSPTNAGDTTWKCICNNAGAQTAVDSGKVVDTNFHIFLITVSSGSVTFSIDGTVVATITTNLPSTSLALGDFLWCDNQNAASNYVTLLATDENWNTTV